AGRYFGARIQLTQPLRERADDLEAAGRRELTWLDPSASPGESQGDRQRSSVRMLISEVSEGGELLSGDAQVETKSPTLGEVAGDRGSEGGAHHDLPGQGNATARSRGRSTLA